MREESFFKGSVVMVVFVALIQIGLVITVCSIAWHFIKKFW